MNKTLGRVLLGCAMTLIFITGLVIGQNKFGQPKSIVHVVTLKWKAEATPEQRQKALDGVKMMATEIPGIKNVWLKTIKVQGPNAQTPFDSAFVMEFVDEAAFKAYVAHPAHKKWEDIYIPLRDSSRTHDITN
ncbi:MAG: Dabb family protein [Acidobacteriota bacterium]